MVGAPAHLRLRRVSLFVALLGLLVGLGAPAPARAVSLGISDSDSRTFAEPYWSGLNVTRARVVVPYDVALTAAGTTTPQARRRDEFDKWVAAAAAHGVTPLVVLEASVDPAKQSAGKPTAPTADQFSRAFAAFLGEPKFAGLRTIAPWNEPNNVDTSHYALSGNPALAATYWLRAQAACPTCTLVAGDFAGIPDNDAYVDAYQAALGSARPEVWAFHAHGDVNDFQSPARPDDARVTRYYLRKLEGPWAGSRIWIDEIGARWRDADGKTIYGDASQQQATEFLLGLATLSPRIDRIYYYNYSNQCSVPANCAPQDRGLVSPNPFTNPNGLGYDQPNRKRPAYGVIAAGGPAIAPAPPVVPTVLIDQPAQGALTNNPTPTISGPAATGNGAATSVSVQVFAGTGATESSTPLQTLTAPVSAGAFSVVAGRLPDGTYTVRAQQASEGDAGVSDPRSFTVDTTPPRATIAGGPAAATGARTVTFTFAPSEPGAQLQCALDRAPFAGCGPSFSARGLRVGAHSLAVRALDAAGNVQAVPTTARWRVVSLASALAPRGADLGATLARGLPLGATCADACTLDARLYVPAATARRAGLRGRAIRRSDPGRPTVRGYVVVASARGRRRGAGSTNPSLRLAAADARRLRRIRGLTVRLGFTLIAPGSRTVVASRRVRLVRGALPALLARGAPAVLACSEACAGPLSAYVDRPTARRARLRGRLVPGARSGLPAGASYLRLGTAAVRRATGGVADTVVRPTRAARALGQLGPIGLRLVATVGGPGSATRFLGWALRLARAP